LRCWLLSVIEQAAATNNVATSLFPAQKL